MKNSRVLLLQEGAYNPETGRLKIRIIEPGLNLSGTRNYLESTLRRDGSVFSNAKMFVDHQTRDEARQRPEGSVDKWVATLGKTSWSENAGAVVGEATLVDPVFEAKVKLASERGQLSNMGVSIRAKGTGRQTEEGHADVESFTSAKSVDFVTFANAGGGIDAVESAGDNPNNLKECGLDDDGIVVEVVNLQEGASSMATKEEELQAKLDEANRANGLLTDRAEKAEASVEESAKELGAAKDKQSMSEAAVFLQEKVKAAGDKLPKESAERITERFIEAKTTDGMEQAVTDEMAYVESLRKGMTPKSRKTFSLTENTAQGGEGSQGGDNAEDLVEAFAGMGLTPEQAKVAARG